MAGEEEGGNDTEREATRKKRAHNFKKSIIPKAEFEAARACEPLTITT
jgi:hypothetical protein